MFADRVPNVRGFGVGIIMISPEGLRLEKSLRLGFQASNNEVDYEALIAGLRVAWKLGADEVEIFSNSRLVVSQAEESFEVKDPHYVIVLEVVQDSTSMFLKSECG